jgi:hypothetical protein
MNEEIKIERVSSLQTEERSQLEKIAETAIKQPLLKGEEFFPKHKLETPERRNIFVRHYLELVKDAGYFHDYIIRAGEKIMGYAAIDKGYNVLKEFFTPTVHFAFVHPLLDQELIEEVLKKECDKIDTANKSGRYQIPF